MRANIFTRSNISYESYQTSTQWESQNKNFTHFPDSHCCQMAASHKGDGSLSYTEGSQESTNVASRGCTEGEFTASPFLNWISDTVRSNSNSSSSSATLFFDSQLSRCVTCLARILRSKVRGASRSFKVTPAKKSCKYYLKVNAHKHSGLAI